MTTPSLTLFVALLIGMAVAGGLLILRIPSFFSSEGGDPVVAGVLGVAFVVFAIGARLIRSSSAE